MVRNPKKRCLDCKRYASYSNHGEFFCDDHKPDDSIPIENSCIVCYGVFVNEYGGICDGCQKYHKNGKTVKFKMKETQIKAILDDSKIQVELYDKQVPGGCSKRRPDFLISTEWGTIVLEIDEHQHSRKNYTCECEITRMKQIYFDVGTEVLLYIRYNPDKYSSSYGNIFSQTRRHEFLVKFIEEYICERPAPNCSVVYLFFDGFTHVDIEEEDLDPYE